MLKQFYYTIKRKNRLNLKLFIDNLIGNSNYANYEVVNKANGTMYIRSKPDGKIENNIE